MESEDVIGKYIAKVSYLLNQEMNHSLGSCDVDITGDQFRLLTHLWKHDGIPQNALSQCAGRDRGSITRMVDILENKGIITRISDKNDRRINLIYLTKKGKEIKDKANNCATQVLSKATAGFTPEEVETFRALLCRSVKNLDT